MERFGGEGAISRCRSRADLAWTNFFFQPVELDFELADLSVQFLNQLIFVFERVGRAVGKDGCESGERLLFPEASLGGVDAVLRADGGDGVGLLDERERDLRFERWRVVAFDVPHTLARDVTLVFYLSILSSFWGEV